MKLYVITDLEGISGVVSREQTEPTLGKPEYERARKLLTYEVNALVEGALQGGAKEVVVLDAHGGKGYNFIIEELNPSGKYIMGGERNKFLPGFDNSFNAMLLLGYHAMGGTRDAVLEHTLWSTVITNYYVNGKKVGEIAQMGIMAGHFNIPVIFVSGDKAATLEAKGIFGNQLETVAVKEGFSRHCGLLLHPEEARKQIKEAVKRSISNIGKIKPIKVDTPIEVKIEYTTNNRADVRESQGWQRVDGRTVKKIVNSQLEILEP